MAILTVGQAAARLHVHQNTIRKAIRDGRIKAQRIGRDWLMSDTAVAAYLPGKPGRPALKRMAAPPAQHPRELVYEKSEDSEENRDDGVGSG